MYDLPNHKIAPQSQGGESHLHLTLQTPPFCVKKVSFCLLISFLENVWKKDIDINTVNNFQFRVTFLIHNGKYQLIYQIKQKIMDHDYIYIFFPDIF